MQASILAVAAGALVAITLAPEVAHGPLAIVTSVRGALVPLAIITVLATDRVTALNAGLANVQRLTGTTISY